MLRWRLLLGTLFIGTLASLCWLDAQQALGAASVPWALGLVAEARGVAALAPGLVRAVCAANGAWDREAIAKTRVENQRKLFI